MAMLRESVEQQYRSYSVVKEIEGTYGLVFILEALESTVSPKRFCVKTVNPAKLSTVGRDLNVLFEREMRLWLNAPSHYCVLPALGIDIIQSPRELVGRIDKLPLVRMPWCSGSLATWLADPNRVSTVDKLIALAQACSGLQWLYDHGMQGHGDLKPDNILIRDLREAFQLRESGFPSEVHPWQARIADLGWADIWCDGGGTYHAMRPYLAPERFQNSFVPSASDVFAIGVVACELLAGVHPAGQPTASLRNWKPKKWEAWSKSASRQVAVESAEVQAAILRCLDCDPGKRPELREFQNTLCDVLESQHGIRLRAQVEAQDGASREASLASHGSWAAEEMARSSPQQRDASISKLERDLDQFSSRSDSEGLGTWLVTSRSLQSMLVWRGLPADVSRVAELSRISLTLVFQHYRNLDIRIAVYGAHLVASLRTEEVWFDLAAQYMTNLRWAVGHRDQSFEAFQPPFRELKRAAHLITRHDA